MSDEKQNKKRFGFKSMLDGSFLVSNLFLKYLPIVIYIAFLFVLYIVNSYIGIQVVYETEKVKKELVVLKTKHITWKSKLMMTSNMSQVTKELAPLDVKPSHIPPYKLFVNSKEDE